MNKHALVQLSNRLEYDAAIATLEEFDLFCDHLEDKFVELASCLKVPLMSACSLFWLTTTAFVSSPQTEYMPYLIYMAMFAGVQFLGDMLQIVNQNARVAALVDDVSKRFFEGLSTTELLHELHLKMQVASRRPKLVVLGFLEVTHANIFALISFLLSIELVIIFEIRTDR